MKETLKGQRQRDFGSEGLESWKSILQNHAETRKSKVYKCFDEGVTALGISADQIPNLEELNDKLFGLTGWRGLFVDGLEDGRSFFKLLANRVFPIGNFIRNKKDLSYTPEPDIVHDLYGHMPFFVNKNYAEFCEQFGKRACEFIDDEAKLRQFERFFWFTIEFGLIKTNDGMKVFGAGIASSTGECVYALSGEPEVLPFDVDAIRLQEFRIDQMQKKLFVLENVDQLYTSLDSLVEKVRGYKAS